MFLMLEGILQRSNREKMQQPLKVQFGSGPQGHSEWLNFDCSPTLRLQRAPWPVRSLARKMATDLFPEEVAYGDVTKSLPLADSSVAYLYCSHVLEHLYPSDCRKALAESYRVLKPGGTFRGVMPDLHHLIIQYLNDRRPAAANYFVESTLLAVDKPRGPIGLARMLFGNSTHRWLWDWSSFSAELHSAGFEKIRRAYFCDSAHRIYDEVENADRWANALGFECTKPT